MVKTKEKGIMKNTLKVTANGVNFMNGEIHSKNTIVPVILLDYLPPESAMDFAKGERFAIWIKLEEAQFHEITQQLKENLREITLWFKKPERDMIASFLNQAQMADNDAEKTNMRWNKMENKDWDKINAQKRIEIALGQAKKQAGDYLKNSDFAIKTPAFEKLYKDTAKLFFRLNLELDDELLNFTDVDKPPMQQQSLPPKSQQTKQCPKCNIEIPKGFMFHAVCGWQGE